MKLVKALLILSAAVLAVTRFVTFKYDAAIPAEMKKPLFLVCVVSAAVCLACAAVWVVQVKKEEKKNKE